MARLKFLSVAGLTLSLCILNCSALSNNKRETRRQDSLSSALESLGNSEKLLVNSVLPLFLEDVLSSERVLNFQMFVQLQPNETTVNEICFNHLTMLSETLDRIRSNVSHFFDPEAAWAVQSKFIRKYSKYSSRVAIVYKINFPLIF